ncbi:MAG: secreted protein containing PKD domain [Bacteroidetes bacterium]|nr:MAG: secreted protein containing PKD domain [Bacteroidota bacterium]
MALFIATFANGQNQGNIWIFGEGAALDFNTGIPVVFSGSQIFGNPIQMGDYLYSEGCTSIADSSGNLLFYSNGEKIWNNLHQVMPNGDSLMGFYSSTNAAFTIPVPSSDSLYYLFTTDAIERYLQNGLRYSVINMCLDDGKGDIIAEQKNILLLDTVTEKLCAVAHPNGTDIWLIAHKHFSNSFYAYLITPSGINPPVITAIGSIHTGNVGFYNGCGTAIGQMKVSSNGNKIGLVFSNVNPAIAELFDFNSTTGTVSNAMSLLTDGSEYGIEFSPDNSRLYTTNVQGVFQFDISSGNQATINSSKTQITNAACVPAPLQLAPDGKIYVARCSDFLGVINTPNNSGLACNYVNNSLNISPALTSTSLPAFIAGYNYNNHPVPYCKSTGFENLSSPGGITIYPNPASMEITLQTDKPFEDAILILCNSVGQKVKQIKNIFGQTITLNRGNLPGGIYHLCLMQEDKILLSERVIITD